VYRKKQNMFGKDVVEFEYRKGELYLGNKEELIKSNSKPQKWFKRAFRRHTQTKSYLV
jgi:hypothetical protein